MTMDRAAIEELFTFTEYSWREHVSVIRPYGDRALTHQAPGSGWPALRDALAHICWAYVGGWRRQTGPRTSPSRT